MLQSLSIKNYALIENLQVNFTSGFTTITGETGAGKSILLGGLALVLGERADLSSLKNEDQKCIIEAVFNIENYALKSFFTATDLDYETQTIIRREILPSGKSRAFINDTPVNLSVLKTLGEQLIDVHSQHQTLEVTQENYQFQILDALANNSSLLKEFQQQLKLFQSLKQTLAQLEKTKAEALKEQDYNTYLLQELEAVNLKENELEELESQYEVLSNAETIQETLATVSSQLTNEQIGVLTSLQNLKVNLQKISKFSPNYQAILQRVQSSIIELDDIFSEIEAAQTAVEVNPNQLEKVAQQLQTIHNLLQKHQVATINELLQIKHTLTEKVNKTQNLDNKIATTKTQLQQVVTTLNKLAKQLHENRNKAIPELSKKLEQILQSLGMPNAKFNIQLTLQEFFTSIGKDAISFLFTANKGGRFQSLKKAASGGELSRIMLAVKAVLANFQQLPTIIFDEIDTGISGEVANKMAQIMAQMSQTRQVLAITHLPQIAAKGNTHLKVFKTENNKQTNTQLKVLNPEQRIHEIAQMLGGKSITQTATNHAKQLLQ